MNVTVCSDTVFSVRKAIKILNGVGGRETKTFLKATYRFDAYMLACFIGNNRCTDT